MAWFSTTIVFFLSPIVQLPPPLPGFSVTNLFFAVAKNPAPFS